jgi:hypothetical protein
MGQAKIKKLKQQREAAARSAVPAKAAPQATTPQKPAHVFVEHVKINIADVVQRGKQQDVEFLTLYWDMQDRFGDKGYGYEVCLHEAAHAILMEQDGIPNVRFEKPAILYNPNTGKFRAFGAMVHGDDIPGNLATPEWILKVTTHAVAGGIALQELLGLNPKDTGDDNDYQSFMVRCATAPPGLLKESPQDLWLRAQDVARTRLTEPETKTKVEARAQEYLKALYS